MTRCGLFHFRYRHRNFWFSDRAERCRLFISFWNFYQDLVVWSDHFKSNFCNGIFLNFLFDSTLSNLSTFVFTEIEFFLTFEVFFVNYQQFLKCLTYEMDLVFHIRCYRIFFIELHKYFEFFKINLWNFWRILMTFVEILQQNFYLACIFFSFCR